MVECNGCVACCRGNVNLFPGEEHKYQTVDTYNPLTNKLGKRLAQRSDGVCFYRGKEGCTIYEDRPIICKAFDCTKFYKLYEKSSPADKRKIHRLWSAAKEVLRSGKERL